ncbi:hypothetical protein U14_04222 [Candidatus Moduliflexus flocculans]|uniref:DUF4282 domain-containing protein n=1 Tax=Candidatus Moduliflexus flocculans TaxID=1499966 RepID=A0A0S6W4D7_9BACT|nr:hypothetical protein U14_04222 [Candidatus Moduliflexus flocculans]
MRHEESQPQKGFWSACFDVSLQQVVTPQILPFLFMLSIFASTFVMAVLFFAGMTMFKAGQVSAGIIVMILAPVVFLVLIFMARVACETILTLFRHD